MGLDVYVGTLTRYYLHDWLNVVQQAAKAGAIPQVTVVRANEPADAITDPAVIRSAAEQWRNDLAAALKPHGVSDVDWSEQGERPYFTDKPAWDCYGHLLLWTAYSEQTEKPCPKGFVKDWHEDPIYLQRASANSGTKYKQLLSGAEWWLPANFDFTFAAPCLSGKEIFLGSSVALHKELQVLNSRTWNVDSTSISNWRRSCPDHGSPLESGARFAFAVFYELSKLSVEHHLPMLLDY